MKEHRSVQPLIPFLAASAAIGLGLAASGAAVAQNESCAGGAYDFVISVDYALDNLPDNSSHTCDYDTGLGGNYEPHQGTFFPSVDGKCTLRRAIRQAGAMASSGFADTEDKSYLINFSGLDGGNGDGDEGQFDATAGQWTLPIDSGSSAADHFRLKSQGILDIVGKITICGPALDLEGRPRVFVDTASSLEIEMEQITLRRLGFFGGGGVVFKESDVVYRQNMWGLTRDGQDISFVDPVLDANVLSGPIGVKVRLNTDNITIYQSAFAGAATKAIEVESGTTNVEIHHNYVGTRVDGTVPVVPTGIQCEAFTNPFGDCDGTCPNSMDWYGGWGIAIAGTGASVHDNVIAGMQNIRSTNDTPPMALEIFGAGHLIENNWIGQGADGSAIGTCGQGFKYSGTDHEVYTNILRGVRNGFENTKGALVWSDSTAVGPVVWNTTMQGNLVVDCEAPDPCAGEREKLFELSAGIDDDTKNFRPGKITSWTELAIEGENGFNDVFGFETPCPLCRIDFYSDDQDGNQEALEHLGFTDADANGDFTFTLASALDAGLGIRTMSTSNGDEVIPRTLAGFTSVASDLYLEGPSCPASLAIDGDTVTGTETYAAAGAVTLVNLTAQAGSDLSVIAGTSIAIGATTSISGIFSATIQANCGL